jgi:hypothetical protein
MDTIAYYSKIIKSLLYYFIIGGRGAQGWGQVKK